MESEGRRSENYYLCGRSIDGEQFRNIYFLRSSSIRTKKSSEYVGNEVESMIFLCCEWMDSG